MPTVRELLDILTRDELRHLVDRHGVTVRDRRQKAQLAERLEAKGLALSELLTDFSRDRLKEFCRALGIDDSGKEKAAIIARLAGAKPTAAPTVKVPKAPPPKDKYSAGEQGLGYIYQARLALLHLLQLPEDTAVFLEKDDDLDFIDSEGTKSLASLKHKAVGDRLTDLSIDFWKSVNIWLARYKRDGRAASNLRFFLFTTSTVSTDSFLARLLPGQPVGSGDAGTLNKLADAALAKSDSKSIGPITAKFNELRDPEKQDFLERIMILDGGPRISDIPSLIRDKHMRSIRREHREFVFERLEGWWTDAVIKQLTGAKTEGIFGYEVSDKLFNFAEEYKADNLPINFRGKKPASEIDINADPRLFVAQLREVGLSSSRIRSAVLDFYRAFEQRSAWARENLLMSGEVEEYEDRLTDEWSRYKDVVFEKLTDDSAEDALREAGATLYNWAEFETGKIESLRIRARVTEPYVLRGSFHILAGTTPEPRVYWHPRFLDRLGKVLGVAP